MKLSPIFILLLIFSNAFATEIDNFSRRSEPLENSKQILNSKMNNVLKFVTKQTNKKFNCDRSPISTKKYFYKLFDKNVGGYLWAKYEKWVVNSPNIDKRFIPRGRSVYRNIHIRNGFALFLAKLGVVVNIDGLQIGSDKLGHFLGIGKEYFKRKYKWKNSLDQVLQYGENLELGIFGIRTTAVYSYGDLAANYEGLLFWERLFGTNKPYFKCSDSKLVQQYDFDWMDYASEAWDEAINCSHFKSEFIQSLVNRHVELECPILPLSQELIERYQDLPREILNPKAIELSINQ